MPNLKELIAKRLTRLIVKNNQKIAIAVSGGADSMSLAQLAKGWSAAHDIEVIALIIDHKLRENSTLEANWVKTYLTKNKIKTHIITWEGEKPKSNIHLHARKKRYDLLTNFCHLHGINTLLVAHTKNDQAETVLQRIKRGSGIKGIASIKAKTKINDITIIRPLLEVNRTEIESYLTETKWQWVDDPSNYNLKYDRVKVREIINSLDEKELWISRLCLLAANAQRAELCLERLAHESLNRCITFHNFNYALLDPYEFVKLDEEIALRVINKLTKQISHKAYSSRLKSLYRILEFIKSPHEAAKTLAGCEFRKHKSQIIIFREVADIKEMHASREDVTWDSKYKISHISAGMRITPLAKMGWELIPKELRKQVIIPLKRILYSTPAIWDTNGRMIANILQQDQSITITEYRS